MLSTMQALDLPIWNSSLEEPGVLDAALADTVRHRGGQQRIPLPVGIGDHEFANDVSADEVAHALHTLRTVAELQAGDIAAALEPEYDLVLKA